MKLTKIIVLSLKFIYLLLAEFEVRTVSYGPSFFLSIYGPSALRARAINREKKTRIRNLRYGTRNTRLIRYLLYLLIGEKGKPFKSKDGPLHLTDARQKKAKSKFYWLIKIVWSFLDSAWTCVALEWKLYRQVYFFFHVSGFRCRTDEKLVLYEKNP